MIKIKFNKGAETMVSYLPNYDWHVTCESINHLSEFLQNPVSSLNLVHFTTTSS